MIAEAGRPVALSFRRLKSRGAEVFDDSRDAVRISMLLRVQYSFLQRRLGELQPVFVQRETHPNPPPGILSLRETSILQLIATGKTTRGIAAELGIAFKTVASHRGNIMSKLRVPNCAAALREAYRLGLLRE